MDKVGFLFDLDGVIIDSEREYTRIWGEIESLFPTGVANFTYAIKGTTLDHILDSYFNAPGVREEVVRLLHEKENAMKYEYCPGAEALLSEIMEREYPIALFTSSNDEKMKHLLCQHPELLGVFDAVITGDQVTKSKPDPEGYIKAAQKLGLVPEKCVVFEDSLQGVKAGHAAGAYVVGVTGTLDRGTLLPYSDIVVDSLSEINLMKIVSEITRSI